MESTKDNFEMSTFMRSGIIKKLWVLLCYNAYILTKLVAVYIDC